MAATLDKPAPALANVASDGQDLRTFIRNRAVTSIGRFASMSQREFEDLIKDSGARYVSRRTRPDLLSLVVIGEAEWPLDRSGTLWEYLRETRIKKLREGYQFRILSEKLFLEALGLRERAEGIHRLYTVSTMTELMGISRDQVRAWVRAGLIEPVTVVGGVWYFDFKQVSAAKTILELLNEPRVTVGGLIRQLRHLREWMPDVEQPLAQLSKIQMNGSLLLRLANGELAADDGQLHFDFEKPADATDTAAPSMRLVMPMSASEWHHQGVQQEEAGYLAEAVESYREALLTGGPNLQISFDLAHALQQLDRREEAGERYRQIVEADPDHADAWNNLGVLLAQQERPAEACEAFRRALAADQANELARYNLADALDEIGRFDEAADHWRAYLRYDPASPRGAHARSRLKAM
jgi:DNA-binding transcriptional MerR regulator